MTDEQFDAVLLAGKGLIAALHERDRHTGRHLNRVATLAERLAGEIGLTAAQARQARAAGQFHDIGKIAIVDEILFKEGPLTQVEWVAMQTHSTIGERILLAADNHLLASIAPIVRHHHERIDGSGYPDQLAGDEIPIIAQVVAIADGYDAMASDRPYRPIRPHASILAVIASEVGTKWDERLVDALIRVFEKDPALAGTQAMFGRLLDNSDSD